MCRIPRPLAILTLCALAADPARESVKDFWRATNVDFENTFSAQITKVLTVDLFVEWAYARFDAAADVSGALKTLQASGLSPLNDVDKNIRKAGQFKETLALGLTFRLL